LSLAAPDFDWEAEGRRLGETLDSLHALVVIGVEPEETARVALGIARAQARRRRVVLADLFGDTPPLERYRRGDDAHGIVDVFLYGVSLTRVAVRVENSGDLYVVPTGSEPPRHDELFTNARWTRLVSGFREDGALLVLVAAAGAPEIERLVAFTDGAVLVGESVPPQLPVAQVRASVRMPIVAVPRVPVPEPPEFRRRWSRRTRAATAAGVALTTTLVAIAIWLAARPLADTGRTPDGRHLDTTTSAGQAAMRSDSLRRDSLLATFHDPREPVAVNPADSADAAAYAVSLLNLNTQAGARARVDSLSRNDPAVTYAPLVINAAPWFQIRVGAFTTAAEAESLLARMRGSRRLAPGGGESVVRAPFAFVLDSMITADRVGGYVDQWRNLNVPAYALRQRDGTFRVYAGAFASPREAILLADSLRAKGFDAPLVYRTGRVF
jgi:hypothetical protein